MIDVTSQWPFVGLYKFVIIQRFRAVGAVIPKHVPDPIKAGDRPPLLLADHSALDFLNSLASPAGAVIEWIGDGRALINWLADAGLLEPDLLAKLTGELAGDMLDALAAEARALREWLRCFVAEHAGGPLTAAALPNLTPLNAMLAEDAAFRQVQAVRGALAWTGPCRRSPRQALLQPLAAEIGDLICDADFRRVRRCEGRGCTVWFMDRTKSGRRRWCSMALCGNRAKATAHRSRQRGQGATDTDAEAGDGQRLAGT